MLASKTVLLQLPKPAKLQTVGAVVLALVLVGFVCTQGARSVGKAEEAGLLGQQLPDGSTLPHVSESGVSLKALSSNYTCIAWRQTRLCTPFGMRHYDLDKNCTTVINEGYSGYCQCSGGITVRRTFCGFTRPFTCKRECAKLNDLSYWASHSITHGPMPFTSNVVCRKPEEGVGFMEALGLEHVSAPTRAEVADVERQAARLWTAIGAAAQVADQFTSDPEPPQWRQMGTPLTLLELEQLRKKWKIFMRNAPPYPPTMYQGRGIVMTSGGGRYFVPSWVALVALRKTGCALPVEFFFTPGDLPDGAMQGALAQLGVTVRVLDVGGVPAYAYKPAAMVLSRFEEMLFLDADNVVTGNPEALFRSWQYRRRPVILWPDYWRIGGEGGCYREPGLAQLLELRPSQIGNETYESGQIVWDKKRAWTALMLTMFINIKGRDFYNLFVLPIGQGDKETYAFALLATGTSYHLIPTNITAIGAIQRHEPVKGWHSKPTAWLQPNTMGQHGTDGSLLFLHTNLLKFKLPVPGSFSHYHRRWQGYGAHHLSREVQGVFPPPNMKAIYDVEELAYQALVELRCAPFLPAYAIKYGIRLDLPVNEFYPENLLP